MPGTTLTPERARLVQEINEALFHLVWRYRQQAAQRFAPLGLNVLRAMVLRLIDRDGVQHPSALAEALELAPPAVSHLLTELEERGLLTRSLDPQDRRRVRLEVTDDGLVVDDTREHYGIVVDRDAIIPVLICMNSSQIKKSKKWMTLMDGIRLPSHKPAPMFSQIYKISTVGESNDQGSWAGFKVEHYRPVQNKAIYDAAKTFREMIRSGSAKPQDIDDNF